MEKPDTQWYIFIVCTYIVIFLKILFEFFLDEKKKERKRARGISPIVFDRSGSSASESYTGILLLPLFVVISDWF